MKPISLKTGFTIVELLVVIVVIGILTAIGVVAFNNVQERAYSASTISTTDAYSKALRMYHIINGRFPNYGSAWSTCLGSTADYPASSDFPAGACTKHTDTSGVATYDYASDAFYNELKTIMKTMPNPKVRVVKNSYPNGSSVIYRGIYYEHQNNAPGSPYVDWAYVEYVLKGKVPCPHSYSDDYDSALNITFCSQLVNAMDTGID
jgi:prepilin-type N-terminal cleavage/methylation domain-containing protein